MAKICAFLLAEICALYFTIHNTVGRNKKAIAEYIRNQLQEDKISDQLTIKEYYDPFTGIMVPAIRTTIAKNSVNMVS